MLNAPACQTMSPRWTAAAKSAWAAAVGHTSVMPLRVKFSGPNKKGVRMGSGIGNVAYGGRTSCETRLTVHVQVSKPAVGGVDKALWPATSAKRVGHSDRTGKVLAKVNVHNCRHGTVSGDLDHESRPVNSLLLMRPSSGIPL